MPLNRRNRYREVKPIEKRREPDTVESLARKISHLNDRIYALDEGTDKNTIAHACSLMATVQYLLENSELEGDDDSDSQSDSDDDEEDSSSPPLLSLRERWSGDLPGSPKPPKGYRLPEGPSESVKLTPKEAAALAKRNAKRVAAMKASTGLSGGDPNLYETTYDIQPHHLCQCGSKAIDHAIDKNLPMQQSAEGPLQPYIMCDNTRAYMRVT